MIFKKKNIANALIVFIIIFQTFNYINCGHVYSWEADFYYQNAGHATDFNLYFSLESGLSATDYINVKFPFTLGIIGESAPLATLKDISKGQNFGTQSVEATGSGNNYFWNFNYALNPGQWYALEIKAINSNSVGAQVVGRQHALQFQTTSGIFSNSIVYDRNPNFAAFSLADSPATTLLTSVSYVTTSSRYEVDRIYDVIFDITPAVSLTDGAYFDILVSNTAYQFTGSCSNDQYICPSGDVGCANIPYLEKHACSLDANNKQKIRFYYNSDVQAGLKFRVKTSVKNPSSFYEKSAVMILSVSQKSGLIYEKINLNDVLQINLITVSQALPKFLWGITEKASFPCPISIYTFDNANENAQNLVYNNINLHFKFTGTTSSKQDHRIIVKLDKMDGLLQGSIYHNLPNSISGTEVKCFADTMTLIGNDAIKYIQCDNIGQMSESSTDYNYFIGAKMVVKTSSITTGLEFGKIQIFTINSNGQAVPLSSESTAPTLPALLESKNYFATATDQSFHSSLGASTLGFNMAVSIDDQSLALTYAEMTTIIGNTGRSAVKYSSSTAQQILFLINPTITQICASGGTSNSCPANDAATTGGAGNGKHVLIKIVFNNANLGIPSSDLVKGIQVQGGFFGAYQNGAASCTGTRCINYDTADSGSLRNSILSESAASNDAAYEHLSFTCIAQGTSEFNCFNSQPRYPSNSAFGALGLKNVNFDSNFKGVSFYPDQTSIDMVICIKNHDADSTTAATTDAGFTLDVSQRLLNIQTINSVPATLYGQVINYYRYSSGFTLNDYTPSLIRINGQLSSSEFDGSATVLSIVLDKEVDIDKTRLTGTNDNYEVGCTSLSGTATCKGYTQQFYSTAYLPGNIPLSYTRIDVNDNIASSQDIDIYVGITLIDAPNHLSITLQQAQTDSRFLKTVASYRLIGWVFGTNTLIANKISHTYASDAQNEFKTYEDQSQFHTGSSCGTLTYGIKDPSTNIIPGKSVSQLDIESVFATAACINNLNNDAGVSATVGQIGGAFILTSQDDIWGTGGITWSLTGTADGNQCKRLKYYYNQNSRYSIICPSNLVTGLTTEKPGDANQKLTIASYSVPSYWGQNYLLNQKITYAWSHYDGRIASLAWEQADVTTVNTCTNSNWPGIYSGRKNQEWALGVTVSSPIALNAGDTVKFYDYLDRTDMCTGTESQIVTTTAAVATDSEPYLSCEASTEVGSQECGVGIDETQTSPAGVWRATTCSGAYIKVNFKEQYQVTKIRYRDTTGTNGKTKIGKFSFSNSYTYLLEKTNAAPLSNSDWTDITINQITDYVRFDILEYYTTSPSSDDQCGGSFQIFTIPCDASEFQSVTTEDCSIVSTGSSNLNFTSCTTSLFNKNFIMFTLVQSAHTTGGIITGETSLTFFGQTVSSNITKAYTHGFVIAINDYVVEDCWTTSSQRGSIAASFENVRSSKLLNGTPKYINNKNARSQLQIPFKINYNLPIWPNAVFQINTGFLYTPNDALTDQISCYMLDDQKKMSFDWKSIELTDFSAINISPKKKIDNPVEYTLSCQGGKSLDGLSKSDFNVFYKVRNDIIQQTLPESYPNNINDQYEMSITGETSSRVYIDSKLFNQPGYSSIYSIKFKPYRSDYEPYTTRILLSFYENIAPRFNNLGVIKCFFEDVAVYCNIISERTISIIPNKKIEANLTSYYKIDIEGIKQPTRISKGNKIWFALDNDDDIWNGVSEQLEIDDKLMFINSVTNFHLQKVSYSNTNVREKFDITFTAEIPAGTIVNDKLLYIQFPQGFDDIFQYQNYKPICEIQSNLTTNAAKECGFTNLTRLYIKMFTDNNNAAVSQIYDIRVKNLHAPMSDIAGANFFKIFTMSDDGETITKASEFGFINAESKTFQKDASKKIPNWYTKSGNSYNQISGPVVIQKGIFKTDLYLGFGDSNQRFDTSFKFDLTNSTKSLVKMNPESPVIMVGQSYSQKIQLSVDYDLNSQQNGSYIQFSKKNEENILSNIPPFQMLIRDDKCSVQFQKNTYDLPVGGSTFPIYIDFQECLPMKDISLTAKFDVDPTGKGLKLDGQSNSTKSISKSSQSSKVFFLISWDNSYAAQGDKIYIDFTVSGSNAQSYVKPNNVTIQIKAPIQNQNIKIDSPKVTVDSNSKETSLEFKCNQSSLVYYAFSISSSDIDDVLPEQIHQNTIAKFVQTSVRNSEDETWKIQGWVNQENPDNAIISKHSGLKSNTTYYLKYYCMDQSGNFSNASNTSWLQPDNGGRIVKVVHSFNASLTDAQVLDVNCALVKLFSVSQERIVTESGEQCQTLSSQRILQANITQNLIQGHHNYTYFFLPDYSLSTDTLPQDVNTQYSSPNIQQNILSLTSGGKNSFPHFDSVSVEVLNATMNDSSPAPSVKGILITQLSGSRISVKISLGNHDGFVYVGIQESNKTAKMPEPLDLRQGIDGDGNKLLQNFNLQVDKDNSGIFFFDNLVENGLYTVLYAAANENPTEKVLTTSVQSRDFIYSKYNIQTVFGKILDTYFALVSLILLALFAIF